MRGPHGRVALAAAAALVACGAGCSFFDPSIGPLAGDAAPAIDAPSLLDAGGAGDGGADALRPVSFRNDIRPLMNRSNQDPSGHGCKACHYSTQSVHPCLDAVGLDLSTLGTLRRGGNNTGPSIVIAGDPADSALVQKLRGKYQHGVRMPRDGPPYWSEDQIALVERWIAEGAIGAADE